MEAVVIAVDMGTAQARAGVFDARGDLLARAEIPCEGRRTAPGQGEYDSAEIWGAVARAVRQARRDAGVAPEAVRGLGFGSTCSLALRDRRLRPLRLSDRGGDVIAWHDHRAAHEAMELQSLRDPVIEAQGGLISPEMQLPRLLWLKRRRPDLWARLGAAFDLSDFLSWRATGRLLRSRATMACKWTAWAAPAPDLAFLARIGLADLPERAGLDAGLDAGLNAGLDGDPNGGPRPVGADLGPLTPAAARDLGLTRDCRVAAGLIDAHAAALGLLGARLARGEGQGHAALIAGTSSCILPTGPRPLRVPGIWGPAQGAVLPGLWSHDAGQSASGAALDHALGLCGLTPSPALRARVAARLAHLRAEDPDLAPGLHVLPDFHGARCPEGDPFARALILGLGAAPDFDEACRLRWRTGVGLGLGLRRILDHMQARGLNVEALHLAGGQAEDPHMVEIYADALGRPLHLPPDAHAGLRGAAIAAAACARLHPDLPAAARAMAREGAPRRPDPAAAPRYARDLRVHLRLIAQRRDLASSLPAVSPPAGLPPAGLPPADPPAPSPAFPLASPPAAASQAARRAPFAEIAFSPIPGAAHPAAPSLSAPAALSRRRPGPLAGGRPLS